MELSVDIQYAIFLICHDWNKLTNYDNDDEESDIEDSYLIKWTIGQFGQMD